MHSSCINNNCTTFCYQNLEVPNSNPNNMQQSKKGSEKGSCYTYTTDNLENPDRFDSRVNLETSCLKRSSKKDRHSKIHTARGPRDRRMRLSLDVAKKFFRLQDMLGFDKASNTIEWLIMKSTPAIQDLYVSQQLTQNTGVSVTVSASNSPSSASECEVLDDRSATNKDKAKFSNKNKKVERAERKRVYMDQSFAKETREKARARARKRASEKRKNKLGYVDETCVQYSKLTRPCEVMDPDTNWFGFSIPSVGNQVQLADETEYPSSCFQFKQGIGADNSAMMSSNWSQSFMFNYLQNPGINSHDQHQFSEFQILGKTWEGINN